MRDDVAGAELEALALHGKEFRMLGVAKRLRQPLAQRTRLAVGIAVGDDDGVLAGLERAIELRDDKDILGYEADIVEGAGERRR